MSDDRERFEAEAEEQKHRADVAEAELVRVRQAWREVSALWRAAESRIGELEAEAGEGREARAQVAELVCRELELRAEVERLRKWEDAGQQFLTERDELRREVERLLALVDGSVGWRTAKEMEARVRTLEEALRIISGEKQCVDNLMSNVEVARAALREEGKP
jgi:hypothetical protein